jgi:intein/homing endonuclease
MMTDTPTLVIENGIKKFRSKDYNYNFNISNGYFERWGKTREDDPTWSPYGCEIMDIEISDGESCPMTCAFCSPAGTLVNTPNGKVSIENLVAKDLVIGFDTQLNTVRVQEIEEVYSRQYTGELVCIELDNGRVLKLTPEHEIFTKNRGWIMSKELSEADEIVEF